MNYYDEIKNKIINCETFDKVKDYSKERNRVLTYYEIGRLLNETGKEYGKDIIGEYSKKLTLEIEKRYDKRLLFRIRKFYLVFTNENVAPLVPHLSWSHYSELISIKDINEINYYMKITESSCISKRELRNRIKSKEYERINIKSKEKIINNKETSIIDFVKNPIIINNTRNIELITEKILHNLIIDDIENFMSELGNSFCFVGSEYKIKIGEIYNYIDLLLFNYEYNCFVVIELKTSELKKEHIVQIQIYMNYVDKNLKRFNQDTTIGIIICKKDNKYILEYSSDPRIIAREYKLLK